jgi:hypothetical protein
MSVGKTVVTADGINAIIEAQQTGRVIKPKYFRFSEQDLVLDPTLSASDIHGWMTSDISLYHSSGNDVVEFVCDVSPEKATHYTRLCGLYLEDGTLFAIAKPPHPFPPGLRQTFKIQVGYTNAAKIMNFVYVPHQETEQDLSLLDTSVSLGTEIIGNSEKIGMIITKIGENNGI